VVEMKDRLKNWVGSDLLTPESQKIGFENSVIIDNAKDEAISALLALGYKPAIAEKVIRQVYQDGMDCESLIRGSLKSMV